MPCCTTPNFAYCAQIYAQYCHLLIVTLKLCSILIPEFPRINRTPF